MQTFQKIDPLAMTSVMDNGHVMRAFSKNILNNWLIWADGPNQRASGDELRAAIDVGRKQYQPKQLK